MRHLQKILIFDSVKIFELQDQTLDVARSSRASLGRKQHRLERGYQLSDNRMDDLRQKTPHTQLRAPSKPQKPTGNEDTGKARRAPRTVCIQRDTHIRSTLSLSHESLADILPRSRRLNHLPVLGKPIFSGRHPASTSLSTSPSNSPAIPLISRHQTRNDDIM